MNHRLNSHQISALINCVEVAAERFRDHARTVADIPRMSRQFDQQADEAFELLVKLQASDNVFLEISDED